jgi:Fe-Mn family superoxide dismutase
MVGGKYVLPKLKYGYAELAPFISEAQLALHHSKHHAAYVNAANALYDKLDAARKDNADLDFKAIAKELAFNSGGHVLHSLFWDNMAPAGKGGGGIPDGAIGDAIKSEFGSFERFKQEFTKTAVSVEGSGWAVLTYGKKTQRPIIFQVEKHNVNFPPGVALLLALDVWEHAYYLDYKNERARFVDAFWNIVDWREVDKRLKEVL